MRHRVLRRIHARSSYIRTTCVSQAQLSHIELCSERSSDGEEYAEQGSDYEIQYAEVTACAEIHTNRQPLAVTS